ncbi:hypothetical protein [Leeuwenhoekiella marinoflava]|nr:hypothetical protein [Leeuwenhoekiella marinoflava]
MSIISKKKARARMTLLERSIQLNQSQIKKREIHLNRYHFLEYNLSEALIIQLEINIY